MSLTHLRTLLDALRSISPLPDDEALANAPELIDQYAELLRGIAEDIDTQFVPEAVASVLQSFGVGDGYGAYWTAVHFIERGGGDAIYPLVRDAVRTGAPGTRKWGCLLLARRRDPQNLQLFLGCLADPETEVVAEAVGGIRLLALANRIPASVAQDIVPRLRPLLSHPREAIAVEARDVLNAMGG